jgi:hypothetical protein
MGCHLGQSVASSEGSFVNGFSSYVQEKFAPTYTRNWRQDFHLKNALRTCSLLERLNSKSEVRSWLLNLQSSLMETELRSGLWALHYEGFVAIWGSRFQAQNLQLAWKVELLNCKFWGRVLGRSCSVHARWVLSTLLSLFSRLVDQRVLTETGLDMTVLGLRAAELAKFSLGNWIKIRPVGSRFLRPEYLFEGLTRKFHFERKFSQRSSGERPGHF